MKVGNMKINIKTGTGSQSGLRAGLMKVFECPMCGRYIEVSRDVVDYRHVLHNNRICSVCANMPLSIPDNTIVHVVSKTTQSIVGFDVGNRTEFVSTDSVVLRTRDWEIQASLVENNFEVGQSFVVLGGELHSLWVAGNGKYCLLSDHEKIEEMCNAGQYDKIEETEKTFTWFRE